MSAHLNRGNVVWCVWGGEHGGIDGQVYRIYSCPDLAISHAKRMISNVKRDYPCSEWQKKDHEDHWFSECAGIYFEVVNEAVCSRPEEDVNYYEFNHED